MPSLKICPSNFRLERSISEELLEKFIGFANYGSSLRFFEWSLQTRFPQKLLQDKSEQSYSKSTWKMRKIILTISFSDSLKNWTCSRIEYIFESRFLPFSSSLHQLEFVWISLQCNYMKHLEFYDHFLFITMVLTIFIVDCFELF